MNTIIYIYCWVAYQFWTAMYNIIEAIAFLLWYAMKFVERRWENLTKLVEKYFN